MEDTWLMFKYVLQIQKYSLERECMYFYIFLLYECKILKGSDFVSPFNKEQHKEDCSTL